MLRSLLIAAAGLGLDSLPKKHHLLRHLLLLNKLLLQPQSRSQQLLSRPVDSSAEAVAAPASLPAPVAKSVSIANEFASLELSAFRGGIANFSLVGTHPIAVPEWRNPWKLMLVPVPVLGEINPVEQWPANAATTSLHSYVVSAGLLEADNHSPLEGAWQIDDSTATSASFSHQGAQAFYRIRYSMAEKAPEAKVVYTIRNTTGEDLAVTPALFALTGVYQDDPLGEAMTFVWLPVMVALPVRLRMKTSQRLKTASLPLMIKNFGTLVRWIIALKSRFFAAFWKPEYAIFKNADGAVANAAPVAANWHRCVERG